MIGVGPDGCRAGWIAIALGESNAFLGAWVSPDVAHAEHVALSTWHASAMVIDIPIGIPDTSARRADVQARAFIGPRRNSVFRTPVRAALEAPDYATARIASISATGGTSLSKQAWALAPKILDVDRRVRTAAIAVREGHPEVTSVASPGKQ